MDFNLLKREWNHDAKDCAATKSEFGEGIFDEGGSADNLSLGLQPPSIIEFPPDLVLFDSQAKDATPMQADERGTDATRGEHTDPVEHANNVENINPLEMFIQQCASQDGENVVSDIQILADRSSFLSQQPAKKRRSRKGVPRKLLVDVRSGNAKSVSKKTKVYELDEDGQYKCLGCDKIFSDAKKVAVHFRVHESKPSNKCKVKSTAQKMVYEIDKNGQYKCLRCEKAFPDAGRVAVHFRVHKSEPSHKVKVKLVTEKKEAVYQLDDSGRYQCRGCEKAFSDARSVAVHFRVHKSERSRKLKAKLDAKKKFCVLANGRYKCRGCKKSSCDARAIFHHFRVHKYKPPHECQKCSRRFQEINELASHVCNAVQECSSCGKRFGNRQLLKQHEQTHTADKNHVCSKCGKAFHVRSSLCAHLVTHATIKPYKCDVCEKSFVQKQNLRKHSRVHTDDRPFECNECGKKFTQSSNLTSHIRIHNKEQPYICQNCGKSFTHKSTLISHRRTHTNDKPFVCSICGKGFSHRGSLKNHRLVHSKEKKFACTYCDAEFAHRQSWTYHENNHKRLGDEKADSFKQTVVIVGSGLFAQGYEAGKP